MLLLASCGTASAENVGITRIMASFNHVSQIGQRDCLHDLYREAQAELDQLFRKTIDETTAVQATNTFPAPAPGPSWAERIAASQKAWEARRRLQARGLCL
jgi:uncharacterized protein YecT (DUF1311 family)